MLTPGTPKPLDCVIVGAGGHGRVVLDILLSARQYRVIGFLDSNPALHGRHMDGFPVLGDLSSLADLRAQGLGGAIVAIGDNGARRSFAERIEQAGVELINAVHPTAHLARNVRIGRNVVVAAGALVSAHCQIGDSVVLNTGCIVDHESMIGTAVHVCPGARLAGRVTVEAGAFVGIGSTVLQCLRIGCEAVIGGGAVVINDVEPMTTVVGVPARVVHAAPGYDDFADLLSPPGLRKPALTTTK
ncbi:MAG TPA: acetyltransferase [Phycisphaerae bacterium]|nr:acetyltransferase [Phycisphaerae bacterium]HRY69474.1 acetyltransferase [Phycisphaerae bacterium]HSA29112.1 acetyltransferase [Phycisphaerae bacterium]